MHSRYARSKDGDLKNCSSWRVCCAWLRPNRCASIPTRLWENWPSTATGLPSKCRAYRSERPGGRGARAKNGRWTMLMDSNHRHHRRARPLTLSSTTFSRGNLSLVVEFLPFFKYCRIFAIASSCIAFINRMSFFFFSKGSGRQKQHIRAFYLIDRPASGCVGRFAASQTAGSAQRNGRLFHDPLRGVPVRNGPSQWPGLPGPFHHPTTTRDGRVSGAALRRPRLSRRQNDRRSILHVKDDTFLFCFEITNLIFVNL